jgi:hypothetical protein
MSHTYLKLDVGRNIMSNTCWFHLSVMGGGECKSCGHFLCHDCLCALHKAIKTNHPNIQDSWLEATMHYYYIWSLLYYEGEASETAHDISLALMDAFLAGATHYYQYDLAIGSTPRRCVDVFSQGAAGSNAPVTHAVLSIEIALVMVNEKHTFHYFTWMVRY